MSQSKTERLFDEVNVALEQLEIALRAIENASSGSLSDSRFHEVDSALQDIRGWIYQRQMTMSSDREMFLIKAMNDEIDAFHERTSSSDGAIDFSIIDRIRSFFSWL